VRKKGYILIELLAVIVILIVIITVTIPVIFDLINDIKKNLFELDAKQVLKNVQLKMIDDIKFNPTSVDEFTITNLLNIDNSNYERLTVKQMEGTLYITIVGKNKWDKLTVSGTINVTRSDDTITALSNGANKPSLITGMTPIKWDGTSWIDTNSDDIDWYNYNVEDKKWANARTFDGSIWVWIPRYIYKIPESNWHTSTTVTIDIQFSKGVDDNWNKLLIGSINLDEGAEASKGTWTNHPAFTFGDIELTGIWVSKFEASSSSPDLEYGGGDVTTLKVKSVPNVVSWRNIKVNNIFTLIRSMETDNTYGWGISGKGIDTHMMKNTEWGAVAYLSQSLFGKNTEIWINNSNTFTTGCAASSVSSTEYTGCENNYETSNGVEASTTGNIYGVYDIVGGAWEYTAAYVDNENSNLDSGSKLINDERKFKDVYTKASIDSESNNYDLAIYKKGDAIYETSASSSGLSSWNGDYSYMPRSDLPWFERGGDFVDPTNAGAISFNRYVSSKSSYGGFRVAISISRDL
jgi:type II secretory pathway pseudopilin PulG